MEPNRPAGAGAAGTPSAAAASSSWSEWLSSVGSSAIDGGSCTAWALGLGVGAAVAAGAGVTALWWRRRQQQERAAARAARAADAAAATTTLNNSAAASAVVPSRNSAAAAGHAQAAQASPAQPAAPSALFIPSSGNSPSIVVAPASASSAFSAVVASSTVAAAASSASAAAASGRPPSPSLSADTLLPPKTAADVPDTPASQEVSALVPLRTPPRNEQDMLQPLYPAASSSSSSVVAASASAAAAAPEPMFVLQSGSQSIRFASSFGDMLSSTDSSSRGKALAAVLLVVLLALLQEPLWLTTASPVLLYSLFGVAQENSREEGAVEEGDAAASADSSASAAAASSARRSAWADRVAVRDSPPAPHIGLLNCNIRMPTPSRPIVITGADRELLRSAAASAAAALASAGGASSSQAGAPMAASAPIPFPSLLSPSPAPSGDPLGHAAMGPRVVRPQQGSSGLVLLQPRPTRNVSDRSVLSETLLAEAETVPASASVISASTGSGASSLSRASDSEEHKEQYNASPASPNARSDLAPSIAASLSRSFQPLSVPMVPRRIDVHQALSRVSPAPASASKRRTQSQHALHAAQDDASQTDLLSSTELSDAEGGAMSDVERAFFADAVRRSAALEALPASAASSATFRMNFTFAFGFEDVLAAFLELGEHAAAAAAAEREEQAANSDTNMPHTPRRRTSQSAAAAEAFIGSGGAGAITPTSAAAHSFALSEYEVTVLSDSAASAASSSSSPSDASSRFIVRRVQTPLSLPLLLRKLLGDVRYLSVEERVHVDPARRLVHLRAHSRSLGNFLSLSSTQRIAPHPVHEGHTRWSVDVRVHVYSSCGLMRAQVQSFLIAAAKQRQHQISLLLSADIKRLVERRKQEQAQQQQQEDAQQQEQATPVASGMGLTQRIARSGSRADVSRSATKARRA